MTDYDRLVAFCRDTIAIGQASTLMHWDQETMMPKSAAEQRATCIGALQSVIHERQKAPLIGELLARIQPSSLDETQQAQLHQIRRSYDRAVRVPDELGRQLAETTSRAYGIWSEARRNNDPKLFLPILEEIVTLKREEGHCLANGCKPYEALLDEFEEGLTCETLDGIFDPLRESLVALRRKALSGQQLKTRLEMRFDKDLQLDLARRLAEAFGYSLETGRLDLVEHPFCVGTAADIRITTRVDEADPFNCLYSTVHETGHAVYEANIDRKHALTPIGQGASMGVHESQSRLFENQLARSREFCVWLFGAMKDRFGDFGIATSDELYAHVNMVGPGFIRTEADEVQYNLHVMLRYALEQDLINGQLEARDLESAWNERFAKDFGFEVNRPSNGFLQDVHWAAGYFGYFPTYTLGNIYAGCLYAEMRLQLPELDESLRLGDPSPAVNWLRESLQQFGSLRQPLDTIARATGAEVSAAPLVAYLEEKYGELCS